MKKTFWKVSNVLMASVITLLGYAGCRSAQQKDSVETVYGPPPGYEEELLQQRLDAEKQAQMEKEEKERQRIEQMKVVYGPPPSSYRDVRPDVDGIYDVVESMPRFKGDVSPEEWVQQKLRYPAKARQNRVEGRVIVSFVVRADGQVDGVSVAKSVSPLLDQEAVRVVKSMPRWQPGVHRGQAVSVRYMLPVDFRLSR